MQSDFLLSYGHLDTSAYTQTNILWNLWLDGVLREQNPEVFIWRF